MIITIAYVTLVFFLEKEIILFYPNTMLISNSISLLFINIFGLIYNVYIEKINRQNYLRSFTAKKIVLASDFSTIVTNKIVYSILPPTLVSSIVLINHIILLTFILYFM